MTGDLVKGIVAAVLALSLAAPATAQAQVFGEPEQVPVSFGASVDVASSYVWRGLELSDEINVQPAAWVAWGPLEIGTWGSHAVEGEYNEQDFWITYYMPESSLGSFALTLNDYYVSEDFGEGLFDFEGSRACPAGEMGFGTPRRCPGGPHTAELMVAFSSAMAPVDLMLGYNFHNDPESAVYGQAGYSPSLGGFDFDFLVGGVFGESEYYYGTDGSAVTNLAAAISRTISAPMFDVPIAVEVVHNPHFEETYFVARAGIAIER